MNWAQLRREILLLVLSAASSWSIAEECRFPSSWQGRWFQGDLGDIQISSDSFLPKGRCIQNIEKTFLLESKDDVRICYSCVVITERHFNVLQYKQSVHCNQAYNSIQTACVIRGDAPLFTLVREPATPIPSPFQGAYTFTYDNMTGLCDTPRSQVAGCASNSHLKFRFKECPGFYDTSNLDLDLEVLATWRDGDNYMYGKFTNKNIVTSKRLIYRCFKYEVRGSTVSLASSADALCQGIFSVTDAPLTMTLSKDGRWPMPGCTFPSWVTQTTWRDMAYAYQYETDDDGYSIRIRHSKIPGYPFRIMKALRCQTGNSSANVFEAVSYTSHGCHSNYQCVRFIKRQNSVIEVHTGEMASMFEDACSGRYTQNLEKKVLIPSSITSTLCPMVNNFSIRTVISPKCQDTIQTGGCYDNSKVKVQLCENVAVQTLECLISWKEQSKTFLVAKIPDDDNMIANCFTIKDNGDNVQLTIDAGCNGDAAFIISQPIQYTFKEQPGPCETTKRDPSDSSEDGLNSDRTSDSNSDSTDNSYNSASYSRTCNNLITLLICNCLYILSLQPRLCS
ncbi:uncharacterized protein LOC106162403 [Lingula anatina]|uniref:Uncharacterized protein LOC106162403 n=1 Tax=Lingula anatina TaxID=7574 RepID=A0A1S3IAG1_LINAN|nr:uncharacterized protein LOC106162403 [Lingula anatina]|eukprot:XP_013395153.1 uncharacterized protein LOC106162403 [Lingula anatina]